MWSNLVAFALVDDDAPDCVWGRVDMLRGGAGWTVTVPSDMGGAVYDTAEEAEAAVERERGIGPGEAER